MDTDLLINGKASKARFKRDLLFGKATHYLGGRDCFVAIPKNIGTMKCGCLQ
jgi:hypothetical protein